MFSVFIKITEKRHFTIKCSGVDIFVIKINVFPKNYFFNLYIQSYCSKKYLDKI